MTQIIIAVGLGLLLTGAAYAHEGHEGPETTDWNATIGYYAALSDILARDTTEGVAELARQLEASLSHEPPAFKGPLSAVRAQLAILQKSEPELEPAREAFRALSDAFIPLLRDRAGDAMQGWNVFGCPMAKGQWIQADAEPRNPYYGKSMLRCGTVDSKL